MCYDYVEKLSNEYAAVFITAAGVLKTTNY